MINMNIFTRNYLDKNIFSNEKLGSLDLQSISKYIIMIQTNLQIFS